jgi:hypothetical protein
MFVWGSTPQLGFDEQDTCLRPRACQLHVRYERGLHEKLFVIKVFHFLPFSSKHGVNPACMKPLRERGTLDHGCRTSPTVTISIYGV